MNRYCTPGDLYMGQNSVDMLHQLPGRRIALLTENANEGAGNRVAELLADRQLLILEKPRTTVASVMEFATCVGRFQPDWIIAVGNCSVLDAAKAIRYFACYPERSFACLTEKKGHPAHGMNIRMVQVPTVMETITCVTPNGVIFDEAKQQIQFMNDFDILPEVAILDPTLLENRSSHFVACAGMDALVDAMEAFISRGHSLMTDPYALQALELLFSSIPDAVDEDPAAIERLYYANCLDSIAFCNVGLGLAHALAHATGPAFVDGLIQHDTASLYLPYVIAFNAKTCAERYARIARAIGLPGTNDAELVKQLIRKVLELCRHIGFPTSLSEAGVKRNVLEPKLAALVQATLSDICLQDNPMIVSEPQVYELFSNAFEGRIPGMENQTR